MARLAVPLDLSGRDRQPRQRWQSALTTYDSSAGGLFFEASSGSMVHTYSLFTVLDMYRRQMYVGWSISARTGIEIESGTGVCGRGSLCTTQGIVDPAQLRMDIRPGPCSRGTLTGDSRTSIVIEEKRSGGDVGSSVRALGSRFTYTRCRFGLQEGSAHLALQRSCGGVWSSVRLERHSARINLWYE